MTITDTNWLQYAEYYPESDEEGYDGEHDGGIKGLKPDAPREAKIAYNEYLEQEKKGLLEL